MKIAGWGNHPFIDAHIHYPYREREAVDAIAEMADHRLIPRGLGRSYGDSALAHQVIDTRRLDSFIEFDQANGLMRAQAGVSLSDILSLIVPRGWFLPVTPGTKYVTLGGAIASDVHGKNHHQDGAFSEYLNSFKIATANAGVLVCSRQENPDLFHATCGGMGLTGVILEAEIRLRKLPGDLIRQTIIRTNSLQETLQLLNDRYSSTYSVAWLDGLARGPAMGRGLIMLGEHQEGKIGPYTAAASFRIPSITPGFLLNRVSVGLFNGLYYHRAPTRSDRLVPLEGFFYPLDRIDHWNRLYGHNGFCQYQFAVPHETGHRAIDEIMQRIGNSRHTINLAVLKALGEANSNPLSFPIRGYTLAMDFSIRPGLMAMFDELDAVVLDHGGRIYLAKDSRMSEKVFKRSYPGWERFMEVRARYAADARFTSLQAQRLGLA